MLSVTGSPRWRTVVGGSRSYVERAVKELTEVHLGTPVRAVIRRPGASGGASYGPAVTIRDAADREHTADAVVIATHPGQALAVLTDPTPAEREVLGAFGYSANPAVLHTDERVLPATRRARAAWNYRMPSCATSLLDAGPTHPGPTLPGPTLSGPALSGPTLSGPAGADSAEQVRVSYDLTRLQGLPDGRRYVVSLNPPDGADAPHPARVLARMDYEHPQYTPAAVAAQRRLPALNDGVTAFAGAYHGWGFHEDGARSGLAAAESLGGSWPTSASEPSGDSRAALRPETTGGVR
jgi:predicted NAD/FAD-binding protein